MAITKQVKIAVRFLRSPYWPAILSGIIAPGTGQLVNGERKKGFFLLFASLGSFFWFTRVVSERLSFFLPGTPDQWRNNQVALKEAIFQIANESPGMFILFHILILLLWGFGIIDAYMTAKDFKKKKTCRSRPYDNRFLD